MCPQLVYLRGCSLSSEGRAGRFVALRYLLLTQAGYILSSEPLHIFDPRHHLQLQGLAGRAATTTLHDATESGVSISGILQSAEDFAVLGWWNAHDYFNHLRLKHLPKTDLSSLKLEFDIEYDQTLHGAMRFDAAKFPSYSRRYPKASRVG